MKENYINLCFVIDESGSMYGSESDVLGGFQKVLDDQRKIKDGKCTISLFKFSDEVSECFLGKDVSEVGGLDYRPGGCTAMNDGIGIAIDRVGDWISAMPEEERPSQNMVVVMTDGMENASKEYTLEQVRNKIRHQTDKYSWSFVYMGTDITDASVAENMGFSASCFSGRRDVAKNYDIVSDAAIAFRKTGSQEASKMYKDILYSRCEMLTSDFEDEIGKRITKKKKR